MSESIASLMEKERDKLTKRRGEITFELNEIDGELARIDAYFGTKTPRGKGSSNRAGRGTVQANVLEVIQKAPHGIAPKDIIATIGSENKQSVHNALTALKKAKRIVSSDGKYKAA